MTNYVRWNKEQKNKQRLKQRGIMTKVKKKESPKGRKRP